MNIHVRRIIAFVFIGFFLIAAPLLIFYTAGYRYNFKKAEIERTGALVLDSDPANAEVWIKGKKSKYQTEARINNLKPGEYDIELRKNGYFPWRKKFNIRGQETAFAENIYLFPDQPATKILSSKIKDFSFSPQGGYAVYIHADFNQDYLYLFNLQNADSALIFNDNKKITDLKIDWSTDDRHLLLRINGQTVIINSNKPTKKTILTEQAEKYAFQNYRWSADGAEILYAINNSGIFSFDLRNNKIENIFELPNSAVINDFIIQGNELFILEKAGSSTLLAKYLLEKKPGDNEFFRTLELTDSKYEFDNFYGRKLGVVNMDFNTYYLINQNLDSIDYRKNNVENVNYLFTDHLLLVQTSQEISYLDLNASQLSDKTITRFSGGVNDAHWHKSGNYVFFSQNGIIKIIELDDRFGHFSLDLPFTDIQNFYAGNSALHFFNDTGLWLYEY